MRSIRSSARLLADRPMAIRLAPARTRRRAPLLIGVIVLLTGMSQLYAKSPRISLVLLGDFSGNSLTNSGRVLASPNGPSTGAAGNAKGPLSASGSLHVTAIVQSSIELTAQVMPGDKLVVRGNQEAQVVIPIVSHGAVAEAGESAEQFRLVTLGRLANLPSSHGYRLEATWRDGGDCTLKIDGLILTPNSSTSISVGLGEPYNTETEHTILVVHPVASSFPACTGTLVLTARPAGQL